MAVTRQCHTGRSGDFRGLEPRCPDPRTFAFAAALGLVWDLNPGSISVTLGNLLLQYLVNQYFSNAKDRSLAHYKHSIKLLFLLTFKAFHYTVSFQL